MSLYIHLKLLARRRNVEHHTLIINSNKIICHIGNAISYNGCLLHAYEKGVLHILFQYSIRVVALAKGESTCLLDFIYVLWF